MSRSTPARLADLQRLKAWPFVSWCFVQRHLVPDLELLLAKPSGCGLPVEWAANDPDSAAAIAEAAAVLGWSANWLRQVRLLAASTICLHTGKRVRELDEPDFAAVLDCLDDLAAISPSARHHAARCWSSRCRRGCGCPNSPESPAETSNSAPERTSDAEGRAVSSAASR